MTNLYESLANSNRRERQDIAEQLVNKLKDQRGDGEANSQLHALGDQIIHQTGVEETDADDELPQWEFTPEGSASLVKSVPRVSGFLKAIERVERVNSAIDAGCGSLALLSIATATLHPNSTVTAYEINEPAVECAKEVVKLFGLEERITILHDDILTGDMDIPEVDLGVTETFYAGLSREKGHEITAVLAPRARHTIPAKAILRATDVTFQSPDETHGSDWLSTTEINLTEPNKYISGTLISTGPGNRKISVYAGYYDDQGIAVIDKLGANNLTSPMDLGRIIVPRAGVVIGFKYQLGRENANASLWVE